ncbi:cilia- and flagella-associated protein 58 [Petromyzon marinus]|uniref:Cilia- and flagella-associated protein 58 n=2 Tax=Petromyzon marinus TaxID=7757 RepID=A0AAJ7SYP1_PETMA|nr:cilia- and flagella-associated protein 58 [Petromyzon marinus]
MEEEIEMEKEKAPPVVGDEGTFESLERDFQEVLSELTGDKSLEKFRDEYEKLHRALKKSHDNEKRLMTKCRELNAEIVANSAKVSTALKLSQEDQASIASLKKEIEKAWKMVDAAHEKEQRAKETIQTLKQEITNLAKMVEQGAGISQGQEYNLNDLLKAKEDLTKERDGLLSDVVRLREDLAQATTQQQKMEQDMTEVEQTISELQQDIQMRQNDIMRETRRKEKLEREVKQMQMDIDNKHAENKNLQGHLQRSKDELQRQEQQLKDQNIQNERTIKESESLKARSMKLQQEYDQKVMLVDQLAQENQQSSAELKAREDEVFQMKHEITRLTKMREMTQKKLRQVEDQKTEVEQQREILKNQISRMEKEAEASKKQIEADKKVIDELQREKELLNKNIGKAAGETQKQVHMVRLHEQSKRNLEQEIHNYKDEAQKQRKIIFQLEKERDRYINEASDLTQKVLLHMEDVKVREMQIFDYKKKIAEAETKLKQQQNLYEAVRSDRNLYSKNLIEAQDEITETKRKLKIMNHQIDQLKEEITAKEATLVKEHMENQRVEKEREALKVELQRMKQQAAETKAFIDSQEVEERKLLRIISEADQDRLRQKKELDQVLTERDVLGTQLVRRNDELALLYEKIKIQQSTLNKGEVQYRQRLEDIRLLKLEIRKLRREKNILTRSTANVEDLRREVYHMQRDLLRERTRCKALEEELENPMNIHRWRKLEGSDPSTYELIQKIHMLQKRLITKTEEVVERELLIQEKEKLYVELKHILARQPGPEVAEQLQIYQQTLREKTKQMKSLASELNMYESQCQENKYEMERLSRELQNVKKKYLIQKRKEQQTKQRDREIALAESGASLIQPQRTDMPRFTGGGFSMSAKASV